MDDFRNPSDAYNYTKDSDFLKLKWVIVRSHDEFVKCIEDRYREDKSFPSVIAFDHDLADEHYNDVFSDKNWERPDSEMELSYEDYKEKTGMHSAKWIIDFCIDNDLILPDYKVHSQNPAGAANIQGILDNFKKHQSKFLISTTPSFIIKKKI